MKVITNAKIITNAEIIYGYNLLFTDTIITISKDMPIWAEVIDADGAYLSAGFIDLHIHGSAGADVMDATPEALQTISKSIVETGTTSFLATTMTMSPKEIDNALLNIHKHRDEVRGAKIAGIHLEGPFINLDKAGAQNPDHIQKPNFKLIEPYMDSIKMITIAPEVEGAKAFIRKMHRLYPDVTLSIGHSDASYAQSQESFGWGVSHATHLFNAMNPLHHREAGVVGAVFDSSVTCDLIADNVHLHPLFYDLVYKVKKEKLILVTDAMRAGCMISGEYALGGQKVIVKDGEARLENGTLAGSVLQINEAMKNFYKQSSVSLPRLVEMVTKAPARKLGLKIGELVEGYSADIVLFDKEFEILKVFVDGEMVSYKTF